MRRFLLVLAALAMLLVACSSSDGGASPPTPEDGTAGSAAAVETRTGVVPGYQTDVDEPSPLVIRPGGPAPIPVTGTDGMVHVVYELEVLNFSPRPAALTRLETLEGGPDGEVVASVEGQDLIDRTILVVDTLQTLAEIPPGRTAIVLVDDAYESADDVPATFSHRLTASLGPDTPDYEELAPFFPEGTVTQLDAPMAIGEGAPVAIGPPLSGDDWLAVNGCCSISAHRGAILPMGGRINASERYAVDWFQVDPSADADLLPDRTISSHQGDPTLNESYLAYGERLLAVADGTVVEVVSDELDVEPQVLPPGRPLSELGGNVVTIDIGDGVFAFYAHLAPGSPTVEVGDEVTRGQVIGLLGNSGNTTEPHLHFHLMTAPAPLTGDNVPFEIDTLTLVGNYPEGEYRAGPDAGPRTDQLPLISSLIDFPEQP